MNIYFQSNQFIKNLSICFIWGSDGFFLIHLMKLRKRPLLQLSTNFRKVVASLGGAVND